MNTLVSNYSCESTFGVLTNELKTFDKIGLNNAGGIAMSRKNSDFTSGFRRLGKGSRLIC